MSTLPSGSSSPNQVLVSNGHSHVWQTTSSVVSLNQSGKLSVDTDIIMKGDSLSDRLEVLEALLHIPKRNIELEQKYSLLKDCWENYIHEVQEMLPTLKSRCDEYNSSMERYRNWEDIKK